MKVQPPKRATRTYVQKLVAPPEAVFPLLCPVREADWIDGWDPRLVVSASGVAELECVFVTASEPHDAIWMITRHEPDQGRLEMVKISPGLTACRLSIELMEVPVGSEATVTYSHTSLSAEGDAFVEGFTEAYYQKFMQDWESRLNHYLRTGRLLQDPGT